MRLAVSVNGRSNGPLEDCLMRCVMIHEDELDRDICATTCRKIYD